MDKEIMKVVDKIAEKLGVAAERVYDVLVHQAFTYGIVKLTISFAVFLTLFLIMKYCLKQNKVWSEDPEFAGVGIIIAVICGILMLITSFFIASGILHIVNPEYYALKDIMDMIHGD